MRSLRAIILVTVVLVLFTGATAWAEPALRSSEILGILSAQLVVLLRAAYLQAPVLVLVLGALLAVPALALLTLIMQSLWRFVAWRIHRGGARAMPPELENSWMPSVDYTPEVPAWPADAWLLMEDDGEEVPLAAEVVSIGRHEDNVLHLRDGSVHRFHAVIHRSEDAHFVITDLSGSAGNGVLVNGERQQRAHLRDGDRIELGRARMTFAAVPQ